MEWLSKIFSEGNIAIIISVFVFVIVLLILAKKGLFSFSGKGLNVGKNEELDRLKLLREMEWCEQFILAEREIFIAKMGKITDKISRTVFDLMAEKVLNILVQALVINHITKENEYVKQKALIIERTYIKMIGKIENSLVLDNEVSNCCKDSAERIASEFVNGILHIRTK